LKRFAQFDKRPIIVALAGPNGAGKTTFYYSHLKPAGLHFVNVDILAQELCLEPYAAARLADTLRHELVKREESFVFETVFSDPKGDELEFLKAAGASGYTVILCYIGLATLAISEERISMRVSQGGHDVPTEKLESRFPRILANLKAAIRKLPHVLIYDNSDLRRPFRLRVVFESGERLERSHDLPRWFLQIWD
jgi:predicted ABC-type ATPase